MTDMVEQGECRRPGSFGAVVAGRRRLRRRLGRAGVHFNLDGLGLGIVWEAGSTQRCPNPLVVVEVWT